MALKTRVAKLESMVQVKHRQICFFITYGFNQGEEKTVIGYQHESDIYLRLPNESDDELQKRVARLALEKRGNAIVHAIYDNF
jgi:hypothetical protein